ncbi:MAG: dihydroorotase [Clostridia bacterium]|nr:dihydroorotase [Clostridia bacterium]
MKIIHAVSIREGNETEPCEIRIHEGRILEIGEKLSEEKGEEVYDAGGMLVTPGFVDIHVHLREPGGEKKETIRTGSRAAALGGYTTIVAMPNTDPVPDTPERMKAFQRKAETDSLIRVKSYGAITEGEKGMELVDFTAMDKEGVIGFSDDGKGVQSAGLMYQAMKSIKELDGIITAHCEEDSMLFGGYIHQGDYAVEHEHRGIHSLTEDLQIVRDLAISEATGCRYHICHMSTSGGVRALERAQRDGAPVTGEVTPHHLLLTENHLREDGNFKMNPPLRSERDREALVRGLREGVIGAIATDHAPHTREDKEKGLEGSAFGIVGLETSFALLYTHLVEKGHLTLERLVEAMTEGPSKIMGLPYGRLEEGASADLTFINLTKDWVIRSEAFASKGKNTPFENWEVRGKVETVMLEGKLIVEGGQIIE